MKGYSKKEGDVQSLIKKYLINKGYYLLRTNSGAMSSRYGGKNYYVKLNDSGTPDLHCLINGILVGIEVKKNKKVHDAWHRTVGRYMDTGIIVKSNIRTINQYNKSREIVANGGVFILTYSLEDFIKKIEVYEN